MNKEQYIKRKTQLKDNRKERDTCYKCYRPVKACFCQEILPFQTNSKIVLLMHPLESKKSHIGTGRMAHVALKNSEIIIDKDFDDNPRFIQLLDSEEYFPVLLYPGPESLNINDEKLPQDFFTGKKPLIFILDGTWPCAKTMMKNTKKLHSLKSISFNFNTESKFSIKQQPAKYCLSTIESIYYLLQGLQYQNIESDLKGIETLISALDSTVHFHKECASNPALNNYARDSKAPKTSSQRIPSKKWQTRKICYTAEK